MIGTTVTHYEILEQLGAGGMGVVYRARDRKLDRVVALKFLVPELLRVREAEGRFLHEAKAASALDHPNICTIHGIEESEDGRLFISMACYSGETVERRLARGPLAVEEAVEIVVQAAQGLARAHQLGIVHRDLKPSNLFVTEDGLVKVLDFGIAKLADQTRVTRPGTVLGTLHYMSPEQVRAEEVDRRTDVWSLGVVLYEMLAGHRPFAGESPAAVLRAILDDEEPVPLGQCRPGVPGILRAAVGRCLRKDPTDRYPDVETLLVDLRPFVPAEGPLRVGHREVDLHRRSDAMGVRPYPGLASFSEEDAEYFHGREAQVEALWRRLRDGRLLAVSGPSGVGKTSFLRAGLIPARPTGWAVLTITPGAAPHLSLRATLVRELAGDTEAMLRLVREDDPDTDVDMARRWRLRHREALLILDQFEELFTLGPEEEQARFAHLISRLVLEADLRVLLSLRDDFLHRCHEHPGLAPVVDGLTLLSPLTGASLRRALVQPALDCGYRFEDPALVDEMMAEVKQERGALPLLAFTLAALWERRDRERGLLTRAAYEEVGSVGGALARHAEAVMEEIGPERDGLVRELFRNLVTAQGTRAVVDREQLLSVFAEAERPLAEEVLDRLVAARLLTSFESRSEDGGSHRRVEVVHESLLNAWPRLVRWRTQDADGAQLRDQLRQAARLWEERERSEDLLWTGTAYRDFALWRERYPGGLSEEEERFARAMDQRVARRRRRRRGVLAGSFCGLVLVLLVMGTLWRESQSRARLAEALRFESMAREELEQPVADNTLALAHAIAALERGDTRARREVALRALWRGPTWFHLPETRKWDPAGSVSVSPDGRWLVTGSLGPRMLLYPLEGGVPRVVSIEGADRVVRVLHSPDGDRLLSYHQQNGRFHGILWDTAGMKKMHQWEVGKWGPTWFHPDDDRLLAYGLERASPYPGLAWWRPSEGAAVQIGWPWPTPPAQLLFPWWYLYGFAPSADLRWLAVMEDRQVFVCAVGDSTLGPAFRIGEHETPIVTVSLDSHGDLVSSADKYELRLWSRKRPGEILLRLPTESHPAVLDRLEDRVLTLYPDVSTLAAYDLRGPVDADPLLLPPRDYTPDLPVRLVDQPWFVVGTDNSESPHSRRVLVYPDRGVWPFRVDLELEAEYAALAFHGELIRDGRAVVLKRYDRLEWIDLRSPDLPRRLIFEDPGGRVIWTWVLDPERDMLYVGNIVSGAWRISLEGGAPQRLEGAPAHTGALAVSPGGDRIAMAGGTLAPSGDRGVRVLGSEGEVLAQRGGTSGALVHALTYLDGRRILIASDEGLLLWDTAGDSTHRLAEGPHELLSVNEHRIAALKREGIVLRDYSTFEERLWVEMDPRPITALAVAPDGTFVAWGTETGALGVRHLTEDQSHFLPGPGTRVVSLWVDPGGRWLGAVTGAGEVWWWPVPRGRALIDRPHREFLELLRAQTNLRVVVEADAPEGIRNEVTAFPGWQHAPRWQEWETEDYLQDPPWTPMLDLEAARDGE